MQERKGSCSVAYVNTKLGSVSILSTSRAYKVSSPKVICSDSSKPQIENERGPTRPSRSHPGYIRAHSSRKVSTRDHSTKFIREEPEGSRERAASQWLFNTRAWGEMPGRESLKVRIIWLPYITLVCFCILVILCCSQSLTRSTKKMDHVFSCIKDMTIRGICK